MFSWCIYQFKNLCNGEGLKFVFKFKSMIPKNSAHSPPPLDVFDTFHFERLISGKKIPWIHTWIHTIFPDFGPKSDFFG